MKRASETHTYTAVLPVPSLSLVKWINMENRLLTVKACSSVITVSTFLIILNNYWKHTGSLGRGVLCWKLHPVWESNTVVRVQLATLLLPRILISVECKTQIYHKHGFQWSDHSDSEETTWSHNVHHWSCSSVKTMTLSPGMHKYSNRAQVLTLDYLLIQVLKHAVTLLTINIISGLLSTLKYKPCPLNGKKQNKKNIFWYFVHI